MYSNETVEQVRACNDIVSVINETLGISPQVSNVESVKTCPFCGDESGCFFIQKRTGTYTCFNCGDGGDVFSYIMRKYNKTFNQAVEALAKRAGLSVEKESESQESIKMKELLYRLNKDAALYFTRNLYVNDKSSKEGLSYITERALSKDILVKFGIGFANGRNDDLCEYLISKGYESKILIDAGLAVESGQSIRDKFRNRIIFPIIDRDGKVLGFGGRVILKDVKPKYLNSPDTLIFDKGSNLYGLNTIKEGLPIILCEGYMDVIAMQKVGINAVASLGTAFTNLQAKILKSYTDTVILSYDNDDAGKIAQEKAKALLAQAGLKGRLLNLEPVKDPDEFIKTYGEDEFKKRVIDSREM